VVNGTITYQGETVMVGDTGDGNQAQPLFGDVVRYELLCRRHYSNGELGA
jgi:thymidine kinase